MKSDWLSGASVWLWLTECHGLMCNSAHMCSLVHCLCVNQWLVCCVYVVFRVAGSVWMCTLLSFLRRSCGSLQLSIMPSQVNITAGQGNHSPASAWNDTLTLNINASYCLTMVPSIRLMYSWSTDLSFYILGVRNENTECSGQNQPLKSPIIINSLIL